jgi:ATP-dependent DNA ligase
VVKPQLCKVVDAPPQGPEWLHEIKYDGYRMHARLHCGRAELLTRTGLDWTHKYPLIAAALSALPARQAYLDGELCGGRPDGKTSFSLIEAASDPGNADALVFFLFDLLYLDGEVISAAPLHERKERLRQRTDRVCQNMQCLNPFSFRANTEHLKKCNALFSDGVSIPFPSGPILNRRARSSLIRSSPVSIPFPSGPIRSDLSMPSHMSQSLFLQGQY